MPASNTPSPRTVWDISAPLDASSPAFPGDTPYTQVFSARIGPGCPVNVSRLTLSPHLGTHADAPLHYDDQGESPAALNLDAYIGPCRVIHVHHALARERAQQLQEASLAADVGAQPLLIHMHHLQHALNGCAPVPRRILVRCYAQAPLTQFDDLLPGFDPATVQALADLGVLLLGTDSASIDPASSKPLPSHQVLRQRGLRVLENLVLDDVPEGDYELIALPLKLTTACASPVRAILRALT